MAIVIRYEKKSPTLVEVTAVKEGEVNAESGKQTTITAFYDPKLVLTRTAAARAVMKELLTQFPEDI